MPPSPADAPHGHEDVAAFSRAVLHAEPDEARALLDSLAGRPAPGRPGLADLRAERARETEAEKPLDPAFTADHVPGPGGDIPVRIRPVEKPRGLVVNLHASGWVRGRASWADRMGTVLAGRLGLESVAPDYRLAPEHPHPAGLDDVSAVLRWAVRERGPQLGADTVVVVGSSAGAHLAVLALLRARDEEPDVLAAVRTAALSYGAYDLGLSPSMRAAAPDTPVVAPAPQAQFLDWAFPGTDPERRRAPDLSPLYADLAGLPPALFTAAARDPLRDDTLFLAARWADAGNDTGLDVWTDCVHAFDLRYPRTAQRYCERVADWISTKL